MTVVVCLYAMALTSSRAIVLYAMFGFCSCRLWVVCSGAGSPKQLFVSFSTRFALWPCHYRLLTTNHGPSGACTLVLVAKTNISPDASHPPPSPKALIQNPDARFCHRMPHTALPTCSPDRSSTSACSGVASRWGGCWLYPWPFGFPPPFSFGPTCWALYSRLCCYWWLGG